ncbi:MBL fold metallo-hydrolase [Mangrovibacillus cuniculi]|uniref:MBL fold metallo-hydrolase n=1 Tax=Mangrovibacillus cuniculi TaxID=2593652 RepID=A0A7S8CDZ2_9BACI|nr:MBL fold metallo-hydrolase [Mangrovibacillus cuniculi]QPC48228.1 MBL fold metallo-hydrolase [Mangrovibacillus cuniculi]
MLLEYFYDEKLAHASYLVGCQETRKAIVIDPMRNIDPYIESCKRRGYEIAGAFETHIHADFVSGIRELHEHGAELYLSDEGDIDCKYQNINHLNVRLVQDKDMIYIGTLKFTVIHTPGHTPESISILLTDISDSNDIPIGIFTGDFVFVNDIGRSDIMESITGLSDYSETCARQMYSSLQKLKELPDYLQIWPAHGAGSACGRDLGDIPSTTVGYEKRLNWAFKIEEEKDFLFTLHEYNTELPNYFTNIKLVNKVGQKLLKHVHCIREYTASHEIEELVESGAQVIDTRDTHCYSLGHIKGTINVPFNRSFCNWIGWLINYSRPVYVLVEDIKVLESIKIALYSVGVDNLKGYALNRKVIYNNHKLITYNSITPKQAKKLIDTQDAYILDVRSFSEREKSHIIQSHHIMLGNLPSRIKELEFNEPVIVQCATGIRSGIAVSILLANGIENVYNLSGGLSQWEKDLSNVT